MAADGRPDRVSFLGFDFDPIDISTALDLIVGWARQPRFFTVVTPNVDHVVNFHRADAEDDTPQFVAAYRNADLTLCDSRILALLAKRMHIDLPVVPGSDLTARLLERQDRWHRLAVVGGDPELAAALRDRYPAFDWFFHFPPMGARRNAQARAEVAAFVEDAGADLIFLAIGAPQSEICCAEIAQRGRATGVALCVGASLEFLTGAKRRAPLWMQRAKLEWVHRLISEPRRLWRRYLLEGPKILAIWWRFRTR